MTRTPSSTDTPQGQTERHCDHERVCMWLLESERRSVCPQTCEHDTRSCPITPAPELSDDPRSDYIRGLNDGQISALKALPKIEAALIQRTREEVLKELFPDATEEEKKIGWVHSYRLIEKIADDTRAMDADEYASMETVQLVLIALKSHLRNQPHTTGSTTSPAKGKEGE